ncbi:GTPase [Lamprobacter modestohalophilus]|nr:GTPase [Lamprobacter modestohalophilus]
MESTAETRFIDATGGFVCVSEAMQAQLDALCHRTDTLQQQLHQDISTLPRNGRMLTDGIQQLEAALATAIAQAAQTWKDGELGRQFSASKSDQLILLIYGKVNAGKSTLLNFLVERFAAHGLPTQRFRLENGQEVPLETPFATACTENTAHVQGVTLGDTLVVLDTPGLLSVTHENHALTERFKVAADGALLLTNSGAPGQTQELDLLRTATESGKPIQIVLTQSDVNEPVEEDDEIRDCWVNKDPARRQGQEEDVLKRARQTLGDETPSERLWAPVSISVKCAREAGSTSKSLEESGFERLYQHLSQLAQRALEYKREKPLTIYQDYLNNVLYPRLHAQVLPPLEAFREAGRQAVTALTQQTQVISEQVLAEMIEALPALLRRHQEHQDVQTVARDLSQLLKQTSEAHLHAALADYETQTQAILIDLDAAQFGAYSKRFVDITKTRGAGLMAAATSGGTALGSAGGALAGPLGIAIGGLIGGLVGSAVGSLALSEESVRIPVGIDYSELQTRIEDSLQTDIRKIIGNQVTRVCRGLKDLDQRLERLASLIKAFTTAGKTAVTLTHKRDLAV